jgi:hypothetical protein
MVVKIPADKVKELLNQIKTVASAKKVTSNLKSKKVKVTWITW